MYLFPVALRVAARFKFSYTRSAKKLPRCFINKCVMVRLVGRSGTPSSLLYLNALIVITPAGDRTLMLLARHFDFDTLPEMEKVSSSSETMQVQLTQYFSFEKSRFGPAYFEIQIHTFAAACRFYRYFNSWHTFFQLWVFSLFSIVVVVAGVAANVLVAVLGSKTKGSTAHRGK
jgi:hypothetical protein